jgi:CheY-like chemotaxis protein
MTISVQPGSGTSMEPMIRTSSGKDARANGAPGKPLRILLVEDSPLLRSRLESMLSQYAAFKVTGLAAAEAEAVEKLDTVSYDAIVVDVELRPGSGIGVIREARARNRDRGDGNHVWIIVLTNYDLPTVRERCMQAGADHFLDKMREIDQLMPILLSIAGRKP